MINLKTHKLGGKGRLNSGSIDHKVQNIESNMISEVSISTNIKLKPKYICGSEV